MIGVIVLVIGVVLKDWLLKRGQFHEYNRLLADKRLLSAEKVFKQLMLHQANIDKHRTLVQVIKTELSRRALYEKEVPGSGDTRDKMEESRKEQFGRMTDELQPLVDSAVSQGREMSKSGQELQRMLEDEDFWLDDDFHGAVLKVLKKNNEIQEALAVNFDQDFLRWIDTLSEANKKIESLQELIRKAHSAAKRYR